MIDLQTTFNTLRQHRQTPKVIMGLFGLWFLYALIGLLSLFFASNPDPLTEQATPPYLSLNRYHLFGVYDAAQHNLPSANGFTLEGTIMVAAAPQQSQAIISATGKPAKVYHEGDKVNEAILIRHIDKDHVVISNNGTLEQLMLPIETVAPEPLQKDTP